MGQGRWGLPEVDARLAQGLRPRRRAPIDEPSVEASIDSGWLEWQQTDRLLERGEIGEAEWFARRQTVLVPAYLNGTDVYAQSGKGGGAASWEEARRPVVESIDRDGTFLDVGCANGLLMASIVAWSAHRIEPYGLDLSPELAAVARRRLPQWSDRIFVGNALTWEPPRRFDFVRAGLEYVPIRRRRDLVAHLLSFCDRLIVGVANERADDAVLERDLLAWGYQPVGKREWPKPNDPRVMRRLLWLDAC
jgi:SAM-dependent methyltransferase